MGFRLEAKPGSPAINPASVIENWGKKDVLLRLNGREIKRGKDFRFGCVRRINHYDLVVWVRLYSAQPVMSVIQEMSWPAAHSNEIRKLISCSRFRGEGSPGEPQ